MDIRFDVYFKKNLGTLFKSNSIDLDGEEARVNIDLKEVESMKVNYLVKGQKLTDDVVIKDIENNLIQVPFKSSTRKSGKIEFEIVAHMKNGDIKPSQTYIYDVAEGIGEGIHIYEHNHSNKSVLDTITQDKINQWDNNSNTVEGHTHNNKGTLDKITDSKVESWNAKSDLTLGTTSTTAFRGDQGLTAYNHSQVAHAPANAEQNVQADWNETNTGSDAYIKNKPAIPTVDVNKAYVDAGLAKKADATSLHSHSNKADLDTITSTKIASWDAKSSFSGSYNDLTDKPSSFTPATHRHNATEIDNLPNVGNVDLTNYYNKSQTDEQINNTAINVLDSLIVKLENMFNSDQVEPPPVIPEEVKCTEIRIEPSSLTIDKLNHNYTLTAITVPENVIEPIEWSCDAGATSISVIDNKNGTATVQAYRDLTANVTVTCGSCSYTTQIIVDTKNILTTSLNFNQSKLVFNNNGDEYSQNITAEVFPRTSTQEIVWTVIEGDESMVRIEPMTNGAKVIPLKVGECKIQGQSGRYNDVCEIVNVQHTETSLLDNPTIKIENHKAVLEQNGYVERFDLNYEPNTGHPQYLSSKEIIGDDGVTYYLSLLKTGSSRFRIDGMVPDGGGWKSILIKGDDSIYPFALSPFPKVNNFNFSYTVANKNDSVFKDLFDLTLSTINTSFEALNITESPDSINAMEMNDYSDSWFGVLESYPNYFQIKLNKERMTRGYGAYEEYKNRWLGTSVHELGHSLGIQDNPRHNPSLYDYGANPDKRWFMQPNDLDVIEYYYKNSWGVDITLTQEEITERLKNSPVVIDDTPKDFYDICFDFGAFNEDELLEVSDVILTGELEFLRKENINIGNDMVLPYNIYKIKADTLEKGELINNELKIHDSIDIEIEKGTKYKMYLVQYEGCPCSLVNIEQGICRL